MLHLVIFATIQLGLLAVWRVGTGRISPAGLSVLLLWCALFGFALDRYAASFWPTPERLWILAVILFGTLPYMVADAILTTDASLVRRLGIRVAWHCGGARF